MKIIHLAKALSIAALFSTSAMADDLADAAAKGKAKFILCGACHGMTGNGQPAPGLQMAASFLESKILKMDAELSALVLFKGLKKDNPAEFMGQIMMPLGAGMPDEDVANIITYIRSEYGKMTEVTTAEQVAGWRAKHAASPQPSRADLDKMHAAKE